MMWLFYHLMALIDGMVYSIASALFEIIYEIATTDFFRPEQITNVANRIYVVVGVLMLFKLVIAAVQYMVNPDVFDDKDKGMSGLLQKIVVSLGLIVVVPAIFNFLISIQKPIITTLPSVILGSNAVANTDEESVGYDLSFLVLRSFVIARPGHNVSVGPGGTIYSIQSFNEHVTDGCPVLGLTALFAGTDSCDFDYKIIISTVAGVFLCYVTASMVLSIAIRTIKLGIIQMLAPIPISSYVFSKDKLNKFVKTSATVYTELFVAMAITYFIIFAIREMVDTNILNFVNINGGGVADTGSWAKNVVVNISLIFGLLMFAKKAPKFLTDLLGLPDVGSGEIADMFKRAGGMFGATVGAGKSYIAARANARNQALAEAGKDPNGEEWKNMSRKERRQAIKDAVTKYNEAHKQSVGNRALRSAGAALRDGMWQSYAKGKNYSEVYASSDKAGQKSFELNKALEDNDISRGDYRREVIRRRIGINSDLDIMNAEIEAAKNASDKSKTALDYVHSNIAEKFGRVQFTQELINSEDFMKNIRIKAGKNEYEFGNGKLKIDLRAMAQGGDRTIAGIMNDLKTVIENQTGDFSGQDRADAALMLDKLQGEADKYIIGATRDYDKDPSKFASIYEALGFDQKINPAFKRLIEEANEANVMHLGDTQYGKKVLSQAMTDKIVDADGHVKPGMMGEWLALNKKMGQNAQSANIEAKGTQAASATLKALTDKYDKK